MDDSEGRFPWHEARGQPAAELLRACGQRLTDRELWTRFQERFHGLIFMYLLRSLRYRSIYEDVADVIPDLAQDVYVRLVQRNGRILRSFRGDTELAALAFLGRVCSSVAADYMRRATTDKRKANVISIDEARRREVASPEKFDPNSMSSILSWIDIEKVVAGEPDQKNARRNALIFKLHYIDGLTAPAIAKYPGFELTRSAIQAILTRFRKRLQK
jgi:hypothetical protein